MIELTPEMKSLDIDLLEAGLEIDGLIHERIFHFPRWKPLPIPEIPGEPCGGFFDQCLKGQAGHLAWNKYIRENEKHEFNRPCDYSTDISAAWQVVEKLGPHFGLTFYFSTDETVWSACFIILGSEMQFGHASSPSLAICRAALKAVGKK